jgi:hypothetical protein
MFDGLEVQASEVFQKAKAFGCYNMRFNVFKRYDVGSGIEGYISQPGSFRNFTADLDSPNRFLPHQWEWELASLFADPTIMINRKRLVLDIGERPCYLKYGSENVDLIEDDSVVYVVLQSKNEGNLPSLLEEHPEWAGRVQVIVVTVTTEWIQDERFDFVHFKVHGAGAPKEGKFSEDSMTSGELGTQDFYIFNRKAAWRGQVTDRDVAADINSLLAGNQLVVLTERVPEVKLPKYEEVESKLLQVRDFLFTLSKEEWGSIRITPSLEFKGRKTFSEASPPIEEFTCKLLTKSCSDVNEEHEEYLRLVELVTQLFPYAEITPMTRPE